MQARLNRGGLFSQWVQAYDVDAQTIRTIYATIAAVFPHVDTWQTTDGDLLLVASNEPHAIDAGALRARVAQQPFRDAMSNAWRVESMEGFLAHFVADETLTRALAKNETQLNTDDRTLVEFGFARGLGEAERFSMNELTGLARARRADRPPVRGSVDWSVVDANRASIGYVDQLPNGASPQLQARHRAAVTFENGELAGIVREWVAQPFVPANSGEVTMLAEALADGNDERAEAFAEQLRPLRSADANFILARLRFRQARVLECYQLLTGGFLDMGDTPWTTTQTAQRALALALQVAKTQAYARSLARTLDLHFAAGQWNDLRLNDRALIAREAQGCGPMTIDALHKLEPWPPWNDEILRMRRDCYQSAMDPRAARAASEYAEFRAAEPPKLVRGW